MTLDQIVRLVLAGGVFIAWWVYAVWGVLQFQDLKHDQVKARQKSMGRLKWKVTNWIGGEEDKDAKARADTIRWAGFAIGVVLFLLTWRATYAITSALSVAIMVSGLRQTEPEPSDIVRLRSALADIMKTDQPPKVTVDGDTLHIAGHPSFKEYQKAPRDAMEQAIEYRLDGDWELADWHSDGASTWTRIIHPPERVDYTTHLDYPWHKIPVGPDGHGDMGIMDLRKKPHWLIAGATRNGKTSALRVALTHLLRFDVEVVALDYKGGLSFLRDRSKVRACATRDVDKIAATLEKVLVEIEERNDLFDQGKPYRKPLIVACDELAAMCERANRAPKTIEVEIDGKKEQVPNPTRQLSPNLETAIRLAAQGQVFFLLSTQRPSATAIPIEVRDQTEGRVAIGPMGQEAAQMMFENEWARATNTASVPGRLVLGEMHGHGNTWRQGLWLADPNDLEHDKGERDLADNLLPPKVRIADDGATGNATFGQSAATHREQSKPERELSDHATGDVTGNAVVTGDVIAETPYERVKRLGRERQQRYRDQARIEMRNPDDGRHGTKQGRRLGCPCARCQPVLAEVS